MISEKQKGALEKVTGKPWDSWNPEAVNAYFAYTDRGEVIQVSEDARLDLEGILLLHKQLPITVELWKNDFKDGLLFLADFDGKQYPLSYLKYVLKIFEQAVGETTYSNNYRDKWRKQ